MTPERHRNPNRTRAREISLQLLYQHDVCRKLDGTLQPSEAELRPAIGEATDDPLVRDYAEVLLSGVLDELDDLDERISGSTENWKLGRLASVDRCILRLAVFELLHCDEVPPKVAIDEAINLAKKFSTQGSGAFVNGVLDRIYGDVKRDAARHGEAQ
jgi:transcription antitermination factor NusB